MDLAAEAEARGVSKSELRDERAREELEPLDEGERPLVVTIGAVISLLIAASIIIAWLAGVEVQVGNTDINERPSAFQVFPPAILFGRDGIRHVAGPLLGGARLPGDHGDHHDRRVPRPDRGGDDLPGALAPCSSSSAPGRSSTS